MKYKAFLFISILTTILNGCRKDFKFENFDYETYNRVVGPDGGTIHFYANYANDTKNEMLASLEFPQGAVDSMMVFNLYQFEDYELATQMEDGFAKLGSKLIYFIPFYESEGYYERGLMEDNYHLSLEFKQPITVTYYPLANYTDLALKNWQEVELYNNYYKSTNRSYKVYRIKIPKIDEWGENNNIFVNWNNNGYANGYDATDLSYIINGRWTASDEWGQGETSMENWELVGEYHLNTEQDVVTFKIYDTDYIYVVARDIYITNIPSAITDYIFANFTGIQIERASYDDNLFKVYFSDNSVGVFDKYRNFMYLLNEDLDYSDLPTVSQSIIKNNFGNHQISKVILKREGGVVNYIVIMSDGIRLLFNQNGGLTGQSIYGVDYSYLPALAQTYIRTNFPDKTITNITYDSLYSVTYTVYLSSNIKVYFSGSGTWSRTYYYKLNSSNLPANILQTITDAFPNAIFSDINYTIYPKGTPFYEIRLVDNRWFLFNANGELLEFEFKDIPEEELPDAIRNRLNIEFQDFTIASIWHYKNSDVERYEVFFTDLSSASFTPAGIIVN